jgi:predicted transposase YbfD/YdcC
MPSPPVFAEVFADLDDPRTPYLVRHRLDDLLLLTLCATICGAESFYAVEAFGHAKRSWLASRIDLSAGVPSHDTLGRLFAALDPKAFERCFATWMARVQSKTAGEVVAIDGKTLRRSYDAGSDRAALQMVSAFACANRLVLGEVAVEHGRGEMTALPEILALLDLHGCVVTLDAAGCHADTARRIVARGADYVLALKGNQQGLHDDVVSLFERASSEGGLRRALGPLLREVEQADGGHGRVEVRRCRALDVDETGLIDAAEWPCLRSVAEVESERHVGEAVSVERRYYVSSLPADPARLLGAVRSHWGVENRVHWVLDVTFSEDASRLRLGHAAANMGAVRRLSLNALRLETSVKGSVATRRLRAGWDEGYLEKVLDGIGSMR